MMLAGLDPATLRAALPAFLAGYVEGEAAGPSRERTAAFVETVSDDDVRALLAHLASLGTERRPYAADPTARRLSRTWSRDLLLGGEVTGVEHLVAAAAAGPVALVGNHLSYIDTTATDALLAWSGHADLAERIVAVAGPKVYEDPFRRLAAACLNTLPAPQSTALDGTERLGPRELARRAVESIREAQAATRDGALLLLYAEGSRTRTGRLRPFLKAVHRYLEIDGLRVVPTAITGTDQVFSVSATKLRPAPVALRFGAPIDVAAAGGAREALSAAHAALAAILPPAYRPDEREPAVV